MLRTVILRIKHHFLLNKSLFKSCVSIDIANSCSVGKQCLVINQTTTISSSASSMVEINPEKYPIARRDTSIFDEFGIEKQKVITFKSLILRSKFG